MQINSAKDLIVYQRAYELSMMIFEMSKRFPAEERFALTSQIRRSSRSVNLNLREAWAKRRYPASFIAKLTDCDGENSETDSSLDFAFDCSYIDQGEHQAARAMTNEIGKMLGSMIQRPEKFLLTSESAEVRDQMSEISDKRLKSRSRSSRALATIAGSIRSFGRRAFLADFGSGIDSGFGCSTTGIVAPGRPNCAFARGDTVGFIGPPLLPTSGCFTRGLPHPGLGGVSLDTSSELEGTSTGISSRQLNPGGIGNTSRSARIAP